MLLRHGPNSELKASLPSEGDSGATVSCAAVSKACVYCSLVAPFSGLYDQVDATTVLHLHMFAVYYT